MEIRINVTTFKYIGETPYTFKASDFKTYIFKKGDLITLEDNHYARFLRKKSEFVELRKQENKKSVQKDITPQPKKQEARGSQREQEQEPQELKEQEPQVQALQAQEHKQPQEA